ncbi:MAG: transposase [Methanosarcinales archaeon]
MNKIKQLFEELRKLGSEVLKEKRGRPKKPKKGKRLKNSSAMQTAIMLNLGTLKGWSLSVLHSKLSEYHNPYWRRLCGVSLYEVPPQRTLSYRSHHAKVKQYQERLYKKLLKVLVNSRNLRFVVVDRTDLPRSLKDTLANWGVCSKGSFFGYKLHLVITTDGVPIAATVTRANERETTVTKNLFSQIRNRLTSKQLEYLKKVLADAGYDSNKTYSEADQYLDAQMIAPPNPRNNKELKGKLTQQTKQKLKNQNTPRSNGILEYNTKKGKQKFKKRIIIEQTIDQILYDLRLLYLQPIIKGVRKITAHAKRILLTYTSILYNNKLHRSDLRNMTPYTT